MLRAVASGLARSSRRAPQQGLGQLRFAETQAVGDSLDWDRLQDFVTSDEGRRELGALRTSFIDVQSRGTQTEKSTSINWDQYKDSVEPDTLALFRKAFSELKFPNYDPSKDIEEAKSSFKPLYEQADELATYSAKRLKEIDQELNAIKTEKEKMSQLTIDEELANHPEIAKEIDKEISEGNFTP